MKRLGLIGGSSASATALLTDHLREEAEERLGHGHAPDLVTCSLDPHEILSCLLGEEWARLTAGLAPLIDGMVAAGVNALIPGSSALHAVADTLAARSGLPVLGMFEPVIDEARQLSVRSLALVGTRCRGEEEAWRGRLNGAGIDLVLPLRADRAMVTAIADEELARGHCREPSRVDLMRLLVSLSGQGAQAVVWTMPELALLVEPADSRVPVWSAPRLCARRAIRWAVPSEITPAATVVRT